MKGNLPNPDKDPTFWSLKRFPGYERATDVDEVVASALTQREFEANFLHKNRPCVVRGGIEHWPALTKWASFDDVIARYGSARVELLRQPWVQPIFASRLRANRRQAREVERVTIGEYVSRMLEGDGYLNPATLFLMADHPMHDDVREFPFVANPTMRYQAFYKEWNLLLFRGTSTDWHYHPGYEAILSQVSGKKQVLLVDSSWATFRMMRRMAAGTIYMPEGYERADLGEVNCYRACLEPGDSLFIPCYWWHAVEAAPKSTGISVTRFFDATDEMRTNPRFPGSFYYWLLGTAFFPRIAGPKLPQMMLGYAKGAADLAREWLSS